MKKILFISLIALLALSAFAANMPDWVEYYNRVGSVKDFQDYYYGVGTSATSQAEADRMALHLFAMSIETKVQTEVKSYLAEKDGKITDQSSRQIKVSSDIGLRGVSVTGRYYNGTTYYSLVRYNKNRYNKILQEELERDIERQQLSLENTKKQNLLKEEQTREQLRKEQEEDKISQSIAQMKKQYRQRMCSQYPEFFKSAPPYQVVGFRNAELVPNKLHVNVKGGLFPLSFEEVFAAYKLWLFELSATAKFYDDKYVQQEAQIKYQILPNAGDFYKTSAAFGFTAYKTGIVDSNLEDADLLLTPFIATNVTIPNLHFTFVSAYADLGKTCLGITNYPFYGQLKDRISLLLETNYIYNKNLRNRYGDKLVVQPGIRFKTTQNLSTAFSYEDNELWMVSLEIGL